jgi:hypothetical protein
MELVFASLRRNDDLSEAIMERLIPVEELLKHYAEGSEIPAATRSQLTRLATVGTSRLRSILQRSGFAAWHQQHMGALVGLVGRLVDIAANLLQFTSCVPGNDRNRVRKDAQSYRMERVREWLSRPSTATWPLAFLFWENWKKRFR